MNTTALPKLDMKTPKKSKLKTPTLDSPLSIGEGCDVFILKDNKIRKGRVEKIFYIKTVNFKKEVTEHRKILVVFVYDKVHLPYDGFAVLDWFNCYLTKGELIAKL